jgi:two-component system nitrate/nitrite response regulator NarL
MDVPRTASSAFAESPANSENATVDRHHADQPRFAMVVLSEVRLVREVLVEALGQAFYCADLHAVATVEEAVARIDMVQPVLVLIDVSLRGGLAVARRLRQRDRTSRLVAFNADDVAPDIAAWTQAGIVAHVGRSLALKEIVERIGTLLNNQPAVDRLIAVDRLMEAKPARNVATTTNRSVGTAGGAAAILTAREEEVVQLIVVGASNKEIARLLDISVATVKSHVHNLLGKLGLTGRGKLALWYGPPNGRLPSYDRGSLVMESVRHPPVRSPMSHSSEPTASHDKRQGGCPKMVLSELAPARALKIVGGC